MSNKDRWSALSMSERADLISMYVKNGITNLSNIKNHYNKFDVGGDTNGGDKKGNNPLLGQVLKLANAVLESDKISDTQRGRLLEFAMRISGGNADSESAAKALKYVFSKHGRKALLEVLSTDTPVSDIIDYSIESSEYTMGDNYGGVAFSNDFWDNDDFIWNNAESDDFVDAYVKGATPYESAGVIRVGSEDPGRLGRYSRYIKENYPDRDIPTYQAHRDTLDANLVRYLDKASTELETSTFGANADKGSYQEAFPFGSDDNRGFFDAAGYNIELVKGPDGKIYGRKSDMYDFLPSDFNIKWAEDRQLHGLVESVDSMGHPFIFRTPWFEATEENVPEEILLEYTEQNKKSLGGKINRFDEGGDTHKATLVGKVRFNPFNAFNRNYRGTNIYESAEFGDAFRQARIDGEDMFVWNDEVYSTELKPNEFVEVAKAWDTEGDLAKEDFRMSIIRNPQGVLEHYNNMYPKGRYTTANRRINEYDIPYMYSLGTKGMEELVMNRYANHSIGDAIWEELGNTNLSYEQKIAILANSYHETNGWTALRQYGNGPASGIYMMEKPQREVYYKWLKDNNLTDSYANQTKFVASLFDNKDSSLITAWDRARDKQEEIRGYKDSNEAEVKGYRAAYNHQDYTTEQAFKDWNSSDLDATTTAFEGLFERAGIPALDNRMRIAHILSKKYK